MYEFSTGRKFVRYRVNVALISKNLFLVTFADATGNKENDFRLTWLFLKRSYFSEVEHVD